MDRDTRRLVDELCTRAGMIMEDCSVVALTTSGEGAADLKLELDAIAESAGTIVVLVKAARALVD